MHKNKTGICTKDNRQIHETSGNLKIKFWINIEISYSYDNYQGAIDTMFDIGFGELIVILVIVVILFGAKKLPELSKSIGESARELRKGLSGEEDDNTSSKTVAKKKSKSAKS